MGSAFEHDDCHVHGRGQREHYPHPLPAIFNGIHINPLTSFQYPLWKSLMGYGIVTAQRSCSVLAVFEMEREGEAV